MNKRAANSIYNTAVKCFVLALLLLLQLQTSQAQKFTATADRATILPNEVITLTYSLDADGDDFKAPDLSSFEVLSGPNVSTRISVYNTQMMRNVSYSYVLKTTKTGSYTIGPASIVSKGKKLLSNNVKITVTDVKNPSANKNTSPAPKGNAFGKDNVFLQLSSDKKDVYQGEAVAINCKIFISEVNIAEYQFLNPAFDGFWVEEVQLPKPTPISPERLDNKTYQAGVIRKVILYPQKNGKLKAGPLELECIGTKHLSRNILDDIFGGRSPGSFFHDDEPIRALVKSNVLEINVKPLPQPQPVAFTGFVGKAAITAKISTQKIAASEPLTLTVTVSGRGNFNTVQPFTIALGDAAEVYAPETEEKLDNLRNDINGSKTFTYTIVPRKEGRLFIPPVKFSYFDPQEKKYVQLKTNAFNVDVEKGRYEAHLDANTSKSVGETGKPNGILAGLAGWLWVLLAGLPVTALLFFWLLRRNPNSKPIKSIKQKTNTKLTAQQTHLQEDVDYKLKEAEDWLSRNYPAYFYTSLWEAVNLWLQLKTGLPSSSQTHENIYEAMNRQGFQQSETERLLALIKSLEYYRYAPVAVQQADMHRLMQEAKHFLQPSYM